MVLFFGLIYFHLVLYQWRKVWKIILLFYALWLYEIASMTDINWWEWHWFWSSLCGHFQISFPWRLLRILYIYYIWFSNMKLWKMPSMTRMKFNKHISCVCMIWIVSYQWWWQPQQILRDDWYSYYWWILKTLKNPLAFSTKRICIFTYW